MSVLEHPLNVGAFAGDSNTTAVAKGMQNLEDSAIAEATSSLSALGIVTGMTVNDSILFLRPDNGDDWWDALEGPGGRPARRHALSSTAAYPPPSGMTPSPLV